MRLHSALLMVQLKISSIQERIKLLQILRVIKDNFSLMTVVLVLM